MENLSKTMECLRDLIAFHTERINGYERMLTTLSTEEQQLATLLNAFIRQSKNMKKELLHASALLGLDDIRLHHESRFGLAWSVVKAVFSSRMPNYALDKCKSGENALLIAYHSVEGTDGLQPEIRTLVNKQKREVIEAREWIGYFERLPPRPVKQSLAAVS